MASDDTEVFGSPLKMVDLEVFIPDLMSEVGDCPVPVIERRLREAIIEACERASVIRWQAPEMPTKLDRVYYEIPVPSTHLQVHSIIRAYLNRNPIANVPLIETSDNVYNQVNNNAFGYLVPNRGAVQLTNYPSRDSSPFTDDPRDIRGLDLFVTLKPSRESQLVPRVLYNDYYNMVISGTLAKLFEMNDTFWEDMAKSERRHIEFEHEISSAKQQIDRGFTTKPNKLRPRRFT